MGHFAKNRLKEVDHSMSKPHDTTKRSTINIMSIFHSIIISQTLRTCLITGIIEHRA